QCHDHKYDPLKQKEYYQFNAFFGNTVEKDIDAPLPGEFGPLLRAHPGYRERREQILRETGIPKLFEQYRDSVIEAMDRPGRNTDWDHSVTEWRAANDRADWLMRAPESELTDIERDKRIDWFLSRKGPAFSKDKAINQKLNDVRAGLAELNKRLLGNRTQAYTMVERKNRAATHIALRGDWRSPGLEVDPVTPAWLPPLEDGPQHPRLRFARWLASRDNPLTARVAINRMWQELFGAGLVG
ncbi:MAG: DUF1553 domain-containing protein, partial [bacterium]|nr:DUF1553 domain-containing protein [bacterium]